MFTGLKNLGRALIAAALLAGAGNVAAATLVIDNSVTGTFSVGYGFSLTGPSTIDVGLSNVYLPLAPTSFNQIGSFAASIVSLSAPFGSTSLSAISTSFGPFVLQSLTFNGPTVFGSGNYMLTITGTTNSGNASFSGFLQTTAVPVPAAVWLMGTALIGLVGIGRRRV